MKKIILLYILLLITPVLLHAQCSGSPSFPGVSSSNPIQVGYLNANNPYIDTKNNSPSNCFGNTNQGQPSDDIWYKFSLSVPSEVYISHCGSSIDTFMVLYNSNITMQAYNDNSDLFCLGTTAGIKITLSVGTYYLVSEGSGNASGDITTTISLTPIVSPEPNEELPETYEDVPYVAKNHIKTYYPRQAYSATESLSSKTPAEVMKNRQYYDGLGRLMQTVQTKASPEMRDIVQPSAYNSYGRETIKYLPYAATPSQSDGAYKITAVADLKSFYNNPAGTTWNAPGIASSNAPFSQAVYELSPLERLLKQGAHGENWQVGSGHEVESDYDINSTQEILQFSINSSGALTAPGYWEKATIWLNSSINEENMRTRIFADKQYSERIYVKRIENKDVMDSAGKSLSYWMDTYYIYNQKGELAYVLPPEFIKQYIGYNAELYLSLPTAAPSQTLIDKLAYQYKYDAAGRIIAKHLPGKEWELIVYNQKNLPILNQDANLRDTNQWLFTKYDIYGRIVASGITTIDTQNLEGNNVFEKRDALQKISEQYNLNYQEYESPTLTSSNIQGYTNNSYPTENLTLHTLVYYDDYRFLVSEGINLPVYTSLDTVISKTARGMETGIKTRILGTNEWILAVHGYDTKMQLIWNKKSNPFLLSADLTENVFSFTGEILQTKTTHSKSNYNDIVILDKFDYDHQGRLIKHVQCLNGNCSGVPAQGNDVIFETEITETTHAIASSYVILKNGFHFKSTATNSFSASIAEQGELIAANQYNEIGQLISKKVGNTTDKALQNIRYAYNIRGWMTTINAPENLGTNLFGMKLGYNNLVNSSIDADPLFTGNISSVLWKSIKDNIIRTYGFRYDGINRLKKAGYTDNDGSTSQNFNEGIDNFTPQGIEYDYNGNILKLARYGLVGNNVFGLMDKLTYSYNGNQLTKAEDPITLTTEINDQEFKNLNTSGDDYIYDANGNMIVDKNKNIISIVYNHLNLPTDITFSTGTIRYVYDASGIKLRKIVSNGIITDYADGFQYENNILKFFTQPEGYVEYNSGKFNYIYQYKDHLGNIRLSYSDSNKDGIILASEIIEENSYYPFGLKHKGILNNVATSTNPALKYKYNGKELQDELGLAMYDYGARNYDPALGRWMNIDPLAEKSRRFSPYTYALNNPVYFIDPDGMEAKSPIFDSKTGAWLGNDSTGFMSGDALFMDANKYKELKASSENGVVDHNDATKNSTSIADLPDTEQSVKLFHTAVDFMSKVTYKAFHGENPTEGLLNGQISVSSNKLGIATNRADNIGTDNGQTANVAGAVFDKPAVEKVSINFDNRKNLNTAGNIGSLFEHEYHFHGVLNLNNKIGQKVDPHSIIYPQQAKSSIFKFTSGNYRTHILNAAKSYSNEN